MADSLFELVHCSTASMALDESALLLLLARARHTNRELGLTGVLLHFEGRFLQVLEGPESAVADMHSRTVRDRRNRSGRVLLAQPIAERRFSRWSMGFSSLRARDLSPIDGFFELDKPFRAVEDPARVAARILAEFKFALT